MTKLAILCPTRGRPEQFKRMVESARKTSASGFYCYIAISEEDEPHYQDYPKLVVSENMPTVQKWNMLARHAMCFPETKFFMLAADDIIFETKGWDKALIDHYSALENKIHVYALRDSRDPDGTPHPIVSREYIEAMGYFMPPIFMHWFIDTWTVAINKSNGTFTHLKDCLLTHDKPSDRGQPDETHSRIRRMGWHSRDAYVNETCGHFLEMEKKRLKDKMVIA